MQQEIIEAFNDTFNCDYESFEEIKAKHTTVEILQTWLEYEGIVGYIRNIIALLDECGVYIGE
jgi:hypothetical protein